MATTTATMRRPSRTVVAQLPLADEIARLRAAIKGGRDRRNQRGDLRWALRDRAAIIRDNLAALETAISLAEEGDEEAVAALRLADSLPLAEAPRPNCWTEERLHHAVCELDLSALIELLASMRREGLSFAVAWARATAALGLDVGPDASVLRDTKEAWRSAYEGSRGPGLGLSGWLIEEPRERSATSEAMVGAS